MSKHCANAVKVFAKKQGINFVYLYDETQTVPKKFGATCTPDPFLFNEKLALDNIINNKCFDLFANSFLIFAKK